MATYSAEVLAKYTDEAVAQQLEDGCPGDQHAAPYLLKLDTPERRFRAVGEAHILSNMLGFRYSQAVADAVHALLSNIAKGTEDQELYGESFCRRELEHQRALREQREAHDRIAFENYQRRMAAGK